MSEQTINELHPALISVAGLSPFMAFDSSPRLNMFCGQLAQSVGVEGATVRRTQSGHERAYGRYTHSIKMPCKATVLKIVRKYPETMGADNIRENPVTAIIYEDVDHPKRQIGIILINRFHSTHQYFGFPYALRPAASRLVVGGHIPEGAILADSPLITDEGDYKFGLEAQIALAALPAVIEDGVHVSESFCQRLATRIYPRHHASWGKERYPLNLYGDDKHYKPFPDIGDVVRPDGLLLALRNMDPQSAVADMTPTALRNHTVFDKLLYAPAGAKVIDIIIHRGSNPKTTVPSKMDAQCLKYYTPTYRFYQELLAEYHHLKKLRGPNLHITPEFERLLTEAYGYTDSNNPGRIQKVRKGVPLDEWSIEIVLEHRLVPREGYKITCCNGGKGIIVKVVPDEEMPVDAEGNRAEVIMDDFSTIKRMNLGRTVEIEINASGRSTALRIAKMLGNRTEAEYQAAWEYALGWFKIVSPPHYDAMQASGAERRKKEILEGIVEHGFFVWTPTMTPKSYKTVVEDLLKQYPACYGPVTYRGNSGNYVTTEQPVLIGGLYMMLLEKIGNTGSGVASALLNHFGIPSKLTNVDKYSRPGRENPTRITGETECRLIESHCPPGTAAELLDRSNNPAVHREVLRSILSSETPGYIESNVDREKFPRGDGRVLLHVHHMLDCYGVSIESNNDQTS